MTVATNGILENVVTNFTVLYLLWNHLWLLSLIAAITVMRMAAINNVLGQPVNPRSIWSQSLISSLVCTTH